MFFKFANFIPKNLQKFHIRKWNDTKIAIFATATGDVLVLTASDIGQ